MHRLRVVHILLLVAGVGLALAACGTPVPTVPPLAPEVPTVAAPIATVTATEPVTTTGIVTPTLAAHAQTATAAAGAGTVGHVTVVPKPATRVLAASTPEPTVVPPSAQPTSERGQATERDKEHHPTRTAAPPTDTPCDCATMPPRRPSATILPADTAPPPPTSPPAATAAATTEPSAAPPAM